MTKTNQKGFTLIELLVVVAIIGILATVVLASLGSARVKARNAAIQAELSGIRASAEIIYMDNSDDYSSVCVEATDIAAGVAVTYCLDSATAWVAYETLTDATTAGFCVDSTGAAKGTAAVTSGTVCP